MESVKNFIRECAEEKNNLSGKEEEETASNEPLGGTLIITACHDFDNSTAKTVIGLDEPHTIRLPHSIRQCFSSSSSHHAFILSVEGNLYSVGRNDHGQLGTKQLYLMTFILRNSNNFMHLHRHSTTTTRNWRCS